jgi:transcriptional regulator with XRE-family HTH domain
MKVDIGHKIKEVFDARNMKLTDFADQLGTVRQNVYRIFKKRHLDTGLLLKISQVLNHNFFQYYVQPESNNNSVNPEVLRMMEDAQETRNQLDLARKEIDYLRKIIRLMEEKAQLIEQLEKDIVIQ